MDEEDEKKVKEARAKIQERAKFRLKVGVLREELRFKAAALEKEDSESGSITIYILMALQVINLIATCSVAWRIFQ